MLSAEALAQIRFDERGLIAAVAQDCHNGRVLMLAWMNAEALAQTLASGYATYWSRSRGRLWRKGEESGHLQKVQSLRLDCDDDALVLQVEQIGVACHTGRMSCFFKRWEKGSWLPEDKPIPGEDLGHTGPANPTHETLARLAAVIAARRNADPGRSYVAGLLARGEDAILKKIGEEATECVLAAKDGASDRIVAECADLWFHCLVMLEHYGLSPGEVLGELERREGISGLDEKSARKASKREILSGDGRRIGEDHKTRIENEETQG